MAIAELDPATVQDEAARETLPNIAAYLQKTLGQQTVVYLSGLNDPKMVRQWIKGKRPKADMTTYRLRYAYQATRMLEAAFGVETTKAWLFGTNDRFNDDAPAFVLRYARSPEDLRPVVPAARAFVGGDD
jgi:hypothetical protein